MVKSSADSLLSVINDILDFSKIEAGKLDFESILFDPRQTLGNALKPLDFRAQQKGVELICDVEDAVPESVMGDPGRLRQVVVNLVGNAIKFTAEGEVVVRIETEPPPTPAQDNGQDDLCLHFSVTDSGTGVPLDKQKTILEAFSQADGSTTRKFGGTGLGLTICSRLVEMMGGRIWVESGPDRRGSTFHFTANLRVAVHSNVTVDVCPSGSVTVAMSPNTGS